jgi:hypothetical protein
MICTGGCKRIVRQEHTDGEGRCIFCSPPAHWPSTWKTPQRREQDASDDAHREVRP